MSQVQNGVARRWIQFAGIAASTFALNCWGETRGNAPYSVPGPAPAGYATLVIYRGPGSAIAAYGDIQFYVNETLVASLGRRTYTYVYVKPGAISSRFVDAIKQTGYARITAAPGETYFLKWTRSVQIYVVASRTITNYVFMDPAAAKEELQALRQPYGFVEPLVRSIPPDSNAPGVPPAQAAAAAAPAAAAGVASSGNVSPQTEYASAKPAASVPSASGNPLPQAGDTWTYKLNEPRRVDGPKQRNYVVKVGAVSESGIVDQLSIDGEAASEVTHPKGNYLLTEGESVFSPYLPSVPESLSRTGALRGIEILDAGCKTAYYVCDAKGRIVGTETISVPAGKFNATKVVIEENWRAAAGAPGNQNQTAQFNGGRVLTIWYAPELKRAIKYTSRPTFGDVPPIEPNFDLELVSYQLK